MYYFGFIHWRHFSHVTSTKYLFADKGDLIVRGEKTLISGRQKELLGPCLVWAGNGEVWG